MLAHLVALVGSADRSIGHERRLSADSPVLILQKTTGNAAEFLRPKSRNLPACEAALMQNVPGA